MLNRTDLVYPKLSYKIIGCAFDVFNTIGGGHKESVYQKAMEVALKKKDLIFTKEQYYPVKYNEVVVGRNFFDFMWKKKLLSN
jgi:GxxExxY protein